MSKVAPADALEQAWSSASQDPDSAKDADSDPAAKKFALELVEGVAEHQKAIDVLLEQHSHNWRLDRMSRIDRNILRLAVYELQHRQDIPRKVTLNEAIELGKNFGTEESSAFINGLLDRIALAINKQ